MSRDKLPHSFGGFLLYFLKNYKTQVVLISVLLFLTGAYTTINSYLTKLLIDKVDSIKNSSEILDKTLLIGSLVVLAFFLNTTYGRIINYLNLRTIPNIKNDIILKLFDYILKHSSHYFQENFSGSIASSISRIAENYENILIYTVPNISHSLVQLILSLALMYSIHPIFFMTLLVWVVLFYSISLYFSNKVKYYSSRYAHTQNSFQGEIVDSLTNSTNIRLFAREKHEIKNIGKVINIMKQRFVEKEWFVLKLWIVEGLSITLLLAVISFSLIKLRSENLVTLGDFALIFSLTFYLCENIWWISEVVDKLNEQIGQCNQSLEMILQPHDIVDKQDSVPLKVNKGKIEFRKVNFCYKKSDPIFENINFTINPQEKIGLVGLSGSGKTTLVNLIVRMFDLNSGTIFIDDQDINKVTLDSLRINISYIPQEPLLFNRTLMENIRYGNIKASDENVKKAAKEAHAHRFIDKMPKKYHTLVGERGVKLSGGQRQRIAVARAILKNSPILILDEATSSLDSITENYIQKSMIQLMKNKTVLVIAHRLSTLLNMDRIIVIENGVIIEDGTHRQLLAKKGKYATLWKGQLNGFLPE